MTSNYHAAFLQFGIDDDGHTEQWRALLARHLGRLWVRYRSQLATARGDLEKQACMGATDVTSSLLARYSQCGWWFESNEWPAHVRDKIRHMRKVDRYKLDKAATTQERMFLNGRREVLKMLADAMSDRIRRNAWGAAKQ